ncbi:MAG TPA: RNA polymerase sigma factor [Fimbriimonadaceae bacterium]|nr:RNA polymerase sigma factor [Fimbriimonadaceae bacterium]
MANETRPKDTVYTAVADARMPFDEDLILVERFVSGDPSAFEVLYSRYYEKVYSLAKGVVLDADEAADTTQEIFALVYKNLRRFNRKSKFSTWLFRVAMNRAIQQTRRLKVRKTVDLTEAASATAPEMPEPADQRVTQAMSQLSPADRAVLTLFYWEELSLNEIAASMGCNVNAAKTRLYRARERFRDAFGEEEPV